MKPATYTVERFVREETDDYGRAGEIEWRLINRDGECINIYPRRWMAIEARNALNAAADLEAA